MKKKEFDPNNPDVEEFVNQIKNGTYNCYEKNEKGENLWLRLPEFTEDHIQSLIDHSKDTTHIAFSPLIQTPLADHFLEEEHILF